MARQPFVDERIVRPQQVEHAAVLSHDAVDEQLRLPPECLLQAVVEVREQTVVGPLHIQIAKIQPLAGEVGHERLRSRISEHAPDLPLEDRRVLEFAARGGIQQLVVGNAAPEKEGEARCQFEIGDAIDGIRRNVRRIALQAEQKSRADEQPLERPLDARVESVVVSTSLVERKQDVQIGCCRRPAIGAPRDRGKNPLCAGPLLRLVRGVTDENAPAAWRVAHTRRREGAGNRDARYPGLRTPSAKERSAQFFAGRGRPLDKGHTDGAGTCLDGQLEPERIVGRRVLRAKGGTRPPPWTEREQMHSLAVDADLELVRL